MVALLIHRLTVEEAVAVTSLVLPPIRMYISYVFVQVCNSDCTFRHLFVYLVSHYSTSYTGAIRFAIAPARLLIET
jgi:hypothetical protein